MALTIRGDLIAQKIRVRIAQQVAQYRVEHGVLKLAVIMVGDHPSSRIYVRNKEKACQEVGIDFDLHSLSSEVSRKELLDEIEALNNKPSVNGILVQLPLPGGLDAQKVMEAIAPEKDVDGFHPVNVGRLQQGLPTFSPCTAQGCLLLLHEVLGDLTGKKAVIVGRSEIVGKPLAQLLLQANCTVTITHSKTHDLEEECRRADILVAAVGKPHFIRGAWIKPNATVIDVGINRLPPDLSGKSKISGDVDFEEAQEKAYAITPVPGGVGPMTVACLLQNVVTAMRRQKGLE